MVKDDNSQQEVQFQWFVMRDLKRSNALNPAWKVLNDKEFEVFTPMHWKLSSQGGRKKRLYVPVVPDLLFVHSDKATLEMEVKRTPTLQFRFIKGYGGKPMTVRDSDMQRFIYAVTNSPSVHYYAPSEINPGIKGKEVRIIGGPLNGFEGTVVSVKGSRIKRLIVEIPNMITAGVEVNPEFIEIKGK